MFEVKDVEGRALVFAKENVDCVIVQEPADWNRGVVVVIRGREYHVHQDFAREFVRDYMRGGPDANALDAIADNINQLDNTLIDMEEQLRGLVVAVEGIERY